MRAYWQAMVPRGAHVLGIDLPPLSLGHFVLLSATENGYVTGQEPVLEDLVSGVALCSSTYEDGKALLYNPSISEVMEIWHEKTKDMNVSDEASAFADYVSEGLRCPTFRFETGDAEKPQFCPTPQLIKVTLMKETSLSYDEIMNRPYAETVWDFITLRTFGGRVHICDDDAIAEAQRVAAALAAK